MKNCPVYQDAFFHYLNSTEAKKLYEDYEQLWRYLEHHTGQPLNSKSFAELYFTLTTEVGTMISDSILLNYIVNIVAPNMFLVVRLRRVIDGS